jgi:hypothetical protein
MSPTVETNFSLCFSLLEYLNTRKGSRAEEGENYIMRSFIICSFHPILLVGLKYQGSDRHEEIKKEWRTEVRKLQRKTISDM